MGLDWHHIPAAPEAMGAALGRVGRRAFHDILTQTPLWAQIQSMADPALVERLRANTQNRFPDIWAEINALATGLDHSLDEVFIWQCRAEILAHIPEGCTTVFDGRTLGHNEDGLPALVNHCFIVEWDGGFSFAYPGSIIGHSFAVTAKLAQMVNNLRLTGMSAEIPRMVLSRAVLNGGIDTALDLLRGAASAGFHLTLTDATRMVSVEYGGGQMNAVPVEAPFVHANHALRIDLPQITTRSSAARQSRADSMLAQIPTIEILRDGSGGSEAIFRCQNADSDEENTIASLLIGQADWRIYDRDKLTAIYRGNLPFKDFETNLNIR